MALLTIEAGLYASLAGGTALTDLIGGAVNPRIYNRIAPNAAVLPYVIFYLADGQIPNETPRQDGDYVYRVDAWALTRTLAETIQKKIFDLLVGQSLNVAGWSNYDSKLRRLFSEAEAEKGVIYWRYTGEYQFKLALD